MRIRLVLPLAGLVFACSEASSPSSPPAAQVERSAEREVDRARMGDTEIALVSTDGGCAVRIAAKSYALGMPAPCRFLRRDRSWPAAVHDYGERGRVLIVAGAPSPDSDYADRGQNPADRCSSVARGILERAGQVALGDIMLSPVGYCPDIGLDEKSYYGVAHAKPFAKRESLR